MRRNVRLLLAVAAGLLPTAIAGCASVETPPPITTISRSIPGGDDGGLPEIQRALAAKEYEASWNERGLQAPNRAHGLRSYFEPAGVRVHDRTAPGSPVLVDLRLAELGRGSALEPVTPGKVVHHAARIEIRRPGLIEWFVNSEAGLEQGFTFAQRPAGEGPLALELVASGAHATLAGDRVLLDTATGRKLAYGKLAVMDAHGETVAARFEVPAADRLRIVVDDSGAAYPLTIDPLLTETADAQLESNQANADFGVSVAIDGDVNGDGYADAIVGAHFYDAGNTDEGAAFVFLGGPAGIGNGNPATAAALLEADQASSGFGHSVAFAGDVNGDGYDDVIVGAWQFDNGQADEGMAFVFLGGPAGVVSGNPGSASAYLEGDQPTARFGEIVASAGDVNGDGYADVIVGAPRYSAGQNEEGAAFLFLGGPAGIGNGNPTTAAAQLESNQADAVLGTDVAGIGDVNGDGYADVIVGAPAYDAGQIDEGIALVFAGSAAGVADGNPATAAAQLESNQAGAALGLSVAGAEDVNGDGYADVIVGAPYYDAGEANAGMAFMFLGSAAGVADGNPATAAAQLESNQAGANLGNDVAGIGDVNGDGYADVIVSAPFYDSGQTDEGVGLVFLGSATGITGTSPATAAHQLEVNQANAYFSWSVAGGGDVNGDGYADLLVGAYLFDGGATDEGAAFVFLGGAEGIRSANPTTAGAQLESNQGSSQLGYSVASAGDVDGDGYADVIVGAPDFDAGESNEGAAFVFLGSATGISTSADAQLESNQADAHLGFSVASAGDFDGDGYGDVIVGAYLFNSGESDEGIARLYLGGASGIATTAAAQFEPEQANATLGYSVASAGDVNGDGYSDVIVGAPNYDNGHNEEGLALVFHGSASPANGTPVSANARFETDQAIGQAGVSVAGAGDVNGDGYADVIIGAYNYDSGEANEGAAFVFLGSASGVGNGNPATADARLESDTIGAQFGRSVGSAGDVDGDGYADVIIGAYRYANGQAQEGAAFLFHGSATGIGNGNPGSADTVFESNQIDAFMGESVAGAGDVNGDGYADVIVGATTYDSGQTDEGAAFVFLGSASGVQDGNPLTASAKLESNLASAQAGVSVAGAGDVNGDGFADVIVGAFQYTAGQTQEGAALVFHGGGNQTGRPVLARQLRGGGSSTPVEAWGSSEHGDEFQVRMRATHPSGRGRVKLEVEACPAGVDFFGGGCVRRISSSWTDVTATSSGVTLTETVSALLGAKLYHWRARVLYAPFGVTQSGITAPANPAHSPWRRLQGQAVEGDLRTLTDTDDDGIADATDTDDDNDGLFDVHETDTGTYVSPTNTGSDPLDSDSDDDALLDGAEVALGTNPNDPDHDDDGDLDGGDNCPFIVNANQANTDALPAGNACQCGDVTNDGVVNATDVARASQSLVGATLGGTFVPQRCNVVGPNDGGATVCDVGDLGVLERFAQGQSVTVQNACQAYLTP